MASNTNLIHNKKELLAGVTLIKNKKKQTKKREWGSNTQRESTLSPGEIREAKPITEREFSRFRALSARANYLAADRPDVLFTVKEVWRFLESI